MESDNSFESLSLSSFNLNGGDNQSEQPSILTLIKSVCADKDFTTLAKILTHTRFVPMDSIDENGNTILHFIIANFQEMGGAPFLQTFLSNPDAKKLLNKKASKSGLTPAVQACSLQLYNVIDMLVNAGADLNVPSRDGAKVQPETTEQMSEQPTLSKKSTQESSLSLKSPLSIFNFLGLTKKQSPQPTTSLELSKQITVQEEKSIPKPVQKTIQTTTTSNLPGMTSVEPKVEKKEEIKVEMNKKPVSDINTEAFIQNKLNALPNKEAIFDDERVLNTSEFIDKMIKASQFQLPVQQPFQPPTGGGRSVVVGQRYLNNIPELSTTISMGGYRKKKTSKKDDKKASYELGRQTADIHQKTLEKIMDLMSVDEPTAKLYKSIIYYKVKNEQPTLSSYERAVEMEKLATKKKLEEIIKKTDIEAEKKLREKATATSTSSSDSEKPKKKKDEKKKDDKKKKSKKETSSSSSSSSVAETSSPELDTLLE